MHLWHLGAGVVHLVSALVLVVLVGVYGNPCIPIHTTFLSVNGSQATMVYQNAGAVCPRIASIIFALLAALDHLVTASGIKRGYPAFVMVSLNDQRNWMRSAEYAVSSTVMVISIAALSGVVDLSAIIAIAGCNVSMILFGYLGEVFNKTSSRKSMWKVAFVFGCAAGLGAWLPILVSFFGSLSVTSAPVLVYFIIFGEMANFFVFAWVFYNQQKGIENKEKEAFKHGEWQFIIASLVAKTWLTWFSYPAPTPHTTQ